jgi:hypothetical protein
MGQEYRKHKDDLVVRFGGMVPNTLQTNKKKIFYGGNVIRIDKMLRRYKTHKRKGAVI